MHLTEGIGLAINAGDLALSIVNGIVMRDPQLEDSLKVRVAIELVSMAQNTVEARRSISVGRAIAVMTLRLKTTLLWLFIKLRIILVRFLLQSVHW